MASEMEITPQNFRIDLRIVQAVLIFSALFLFSDERFREENYASHQYVLAVLLFDVSLLIPSKLNYVTGSSPSWKFLLRRSIGITYHLFIYVSLIGSFVYQAKALSGGHEEGFERWYAFRVFVMIITAFTAAMRINRLVRYFKETRKIVASPNELKTDVEIGTIYQGNNQRVMLTVKVYDL